MPLSDTKLARAPLYVAAYWGVAASYEVTTRRGVPTVHAGPGEWRFWPLEDETYVLAAMHAFAESESDDAFRLAVSRFGLLNPIDPTGSSTGVEEWRVAYQPIHELRRQARDFADVEQQVNQLLADEPIGERPIVVRSWADVGKFDQLAVVERCWAGLDSAGFTFEPIPTVSLNDGPSLRLGIIPRSLLGAAYAHLLVRLARESAVAGDWRGTRWVPCSREGCDNSRIERRKVASPYCGQACRQAVRRERERRANLSSVLGTG